jgi:glycosyltransferase involved in cell wall biosynthesis
MYHANLAALLVHRLALRRPSLIWGVRHSLDDIFADSKSTRFAIKVGRLTSGAPNAIVYNSATARLQHERAGYCVTHSRVIPNGFDTRRWQPDPIAREAVRREFGIPSGDLVVGFVGRFHAVKDLPNFYAALKPLMGRHARLHCVVAGRDTGAENPELAAAIAALPVSRTHLLGERDDIERIIASFDFLCLSSRSEAFPNVVGEAMSCGVPCVVTNVGDAAAIVGETGLVVPTEDSRALSTALDRMASLSEVERHELGRAARVRIESSFSLSHTVQEYDDLYQSVMAN